MQRAPKGLNQAGRRLWRWLTAAFDTTGCEPLATELCVVADRLAAVRALLPEATTAADRGRLIASEVRLLGQYARLWRVLGLADADTEHRPVGRPPSTER